LRIISLALVLRRPVVYNCYMTNILPAIRSELAQQADAKTKESFQRFFKEKVTAYGVKTALVTRIARKYFKEASPLGKSGVFALCEELLKSDYTEEAFIASEWAYWLRDEYEPGDFIVFERWLNRYINNWAKCDSLCNHAIGAFVEKYPRYIDNLKNWTRSKNRWLRRASSAPDPSSARSIRRRSGRRRGRCRGRRSSRPAIWR